MSGQWGPIARPRQATKEFASICWRCRTRIQQYALYHDSPLIRKISASEVGAPDSQEHNSKSEQTFRRVETEASGNHRTFASIRSYATATETLVARDSHTLASLNNVPGHWQQPQPPVGNIRDKLRIWQEQQGPAVFTKPVSLESDRGQSSNMQNLVTRSPGEKRIDEPVLIQGDAAEARERNAFINDDHQVAERISDELHLESGDMVELICAGYLVLAVYVRLVGRQVQFYTMEGEWIHRPLRFVYWATRHFVSPAEVAPLLPHLPSTEIPFEEIDELHSMGVEVPRDVGAPLTKKMNQFLLESNEVYRAHADRLDHVYDLLADPKHLRYMTLKEAASIVLHATYPSKISEQALLAVHRAMLNIEVGISTEIRDHWTGGTYEILSKRELSVVFQVREWLREYQEELIMRAKPTQSGHQAGHSGRFSVEGRGVQIIENFVKRARQVVENSRQYRQLTNSGGIGPSLILPEAAKNNYNMAVKHVSIGSFSEADSVILRFIEMWAARGCMKKTSQISAVGPMLLRAIGMYKGFDLDRRTGFTFLQEMGVIAPWENRIAFNARLALPGHNFDTITDDLQTDAFLSLRDWAPQDSMKHLRKDWGDLEVYCIDSVNAAEIDDGISLERVSDEKSQYWIHVHVANPTSFIPPEHPISKYAAQLSETLYFPEKVYPMLNPKITQKHFSLDKDRPTLTFSAKLNAEGEILETKIQPGVIRNVMYFTQDTIAQELASTDKELTPVSRLTVGRNPPLAISKDRGKHLSEKLNDSQRETLLKLKELSNARQRLRTAKGALNVGFSNGDTTVHYAEPTLPYRKTIRRIDGDPTISFSTAVFDPNPGSNTQNISSGDSLVPNFMILACEVAALWTQSRGIPVLYRGTTRDPHLPSPAEYKRVVLDPLVGEDGLPPYLKKVEYMTLVGKSYTSVDPVHHQMIGADAYSKITSPLRRYGDMVGHWQIEAAIRREAETGKSLIGTTDHSYLPFSRRMILDLLPYVATRESHIALAKHTAQLHWIVQAIFRAYYFKEAPLPETFEVYLWATDNVTRRQWRGITKELQLSVFLKESTLSGKAGGMQPGDWWEAKIESVDTFMRDIIMVPVRLIERAEPTLGMDDVVRLSAS
ncbi:hypothetical protein MMC13_005111 [Lambiella insularis]|nr:hypothetical protein [Lambiella insularis]